METTDTLPIEEVELRYMRDVKALKKAYNDLTFSEDIGDTAQRTLQYAITRLEFYQKKFTDLVKHVNDTVKANPDDFTHPRWHNFDKCMKICNRYMEWMVHIANEMGKRSPTQIDTPGGSIEYRLNVDAGISQISLLSEATDVIQDYLLETDNFLEYAGTYEEITYLFENVAFFKGDTDRQMLFLILLQRGFRIQNNTTMADTLGGKNFADRVVNEVLHSLTPGSTGKSVSAFMPSVVPPTHDMGDLKGHGGQQDGNVLAGRTTPPNRRRSRSTSTNKKDDDSNPASESVFVELSKAMVEDDIGFWETILSGLISVSVFYDWFMPIRGWLFMLQYKQHLSDCFRKALISNEIKIFIETNYLNQRKVKTPNATEEKLKDLSIRQKLAADFWPELVSRLNVNPETRFTFHDFTILFGPVMTITKSFKILENWPGAEKLLNFGVVEIAERIMGKNLEDALLTTIDPASVNATNTSIYRPSEELAIAINRTALMEKPIKREDMPQALLENPDATFIFNDDGRSYVDYVRVKYEIKDIGKKKILKKVYEGPSLVEDGIYTATTLNIAAKYEFVGASKPTPFKASTPDTQQFDNQITAVANHPGIRQTLINYVFPTFNTTIDPKTITDQSTLWNDNKKLMDGGKLTPYGAYMGIRHMFTVIGRFFLPVSPGPNKGWFSLMNFMGMFQRTAYAYHTLAEVTAFSILMGTNVNAFAALSSNALVQHSANVTISYAYSIIEQERIRAILRGGGAMLGLIQAAATWRNVEKDVSFLEYAATRAIIGQETTSSLAGVRLTISKGLESMYNIFRPGHHLPVFGSTWKTHIELVSQSSRLAGFGNNFYNMMVYLLRQNALVITAMALNYKTVMTILNPFLWFATNEISDTTLALETMNTPTAPIKSWVERIQEGLNGIFGNKTITIDVNNPGSTSYSDFAVLKMRHDAQYVANTVGGFFDYTFGPISGTRALENVISFVSIPLVFGTVMAGVSKKSEFAIGPTLTFWVTATVTTMFQLGFGDIFGNAMWNLPWYVKLTVAGYSLYTAIFSFGPYMLEKIASMAISSRTIRGKPSNTTSSTTPNVPPPLPQQTTKDMRLLSKKRWNFANYTFIVTIFLFAYVAFNMPMYHINAPNIPVKSDAHYNADDSDDE